MTYFVWESDSEGNYLEIAEIASLEGLNDINIGLHSSYRITNKWGIVADFTTHVSFSKQTGPNVRDEVRNTLTTGSPRERGMNANG